MRKARLKRWKPCASRATRPRQMGRKSGLEDAPRSDTDRDSGRGQHCGRRVHEECVDFCRRGRCRFQRRTASPGSSRQRFLRVRGFGAKRAQPGRRVAAGQGDHARCARRPWAIRHGDAVHAAHPSHGRHHGPRRAGTRQGATCTARGHPAHAGADQGGAWRRGDREPCGWAINTLPASGPSADAGGGHELGQDRRHRRTHPCAGHGQWRVPGSRRSVDGFSASGRSASCTECCAGGRRGSRRAGAATRRRHAGADFVGLDRNELGRRSDDPGRDQAGSTGTSNRQW